MGFVAGLLLIYMSEESAFFTLIRLMKDFELAGLYSPGFPRLRKSAKQTQHKHPAGLMSRWQTKCFMFIRNFSRNTCQRWHVTLTSWVLM